jgi:nitrate/nitrite transporter NarK
MGAPEIGKGCVSDKIGREKIMKFAFMTFIVVNGVKSIFSGKKH